MTDRKKVIKGLEMCIKDIECTGCPYEEECFDVTDDRQFGESMMRDALTLLKEQEAVEPKEIVNEHFPIGDFRRTIGWHCGKCGKTLMGDGDYCSYCGRAVKWE